jgi:hypothetical protein
MAESKKAAEGNRDPAGAGRAGKTKSSAGDDQSGKSGRKRSAAATDAPAEPTKKGRGGAPSAAAGGMPTAPAGGAAEESARPKKAQRSGGVRTRTGPDLKRDLKDFVSARPHGWGHDDWLQFLEDLRERGHNIEDREAIGMALEQERLDHSLSNVKGLTGPRRRPLVERFKTVWSLRNAGVDEIASTAGVSREVADRIKAEI